MEFYYDGEWYIVSAKAADTIPVGAIIEYPSLTAPYGYLLCDGRAVSRTEYADLFAAIGTTHGAGDGSTTFNLPTRKGRNAIGYDPNDTDFNTIGKTGGEKTHTLTVDEMPSHNHAIYTNTAPGETSTNWGMTTNLQGDTVYANYGRMTSSGNNQAHNILQPYQVSAFYIKYKQSIGVLANTKNETTTSDVDAYSCNYINGTVLYDNPSGATGNLSLNDSISNYNRFKIYYSAPDDYVGIAEFYVKSGATYAIDKNRLDSGELRIYQEKIQISGTSVTSLTNRTYSTVSGISSDNPISIIKVIGYK